MGFERSALFQDFGGERCFYLTLQRNKLLDRHRLQRHTHFLRDAKLNNTLTRESSRIYYFIIKEKPLRRDYRLGANAHGGEIGTAVHSAMLSMLHSCTSDS